MVTKWRREQLNWGLGLSASLLVLFAGPALAAAATLKLSPTSGSFDAGGTLEVKVLLDTSGAATSGTDADLTFDPNVLQVVDANNSLTGVQIAAGSLYSQTTYNLADNSQGKISFSGAMPAQSTGYAGSGTLATITFEAIKESSATAVTLDFTKGSLTDSGVFDKSSKEDVLSSVTNASFTVTAVADSEDVPGAGDAATDDGTSGGANSGGAAGTDGTDGSGGSSEVADTGIDLSGYLALTLLSFFGAGYFLTRRQRRTG